MNTVLVPARRIQRWFENFGERHGHHTLSVEDGALKAIAEDGEQAVARLPWGRRYAGELTRQAFAAQVEAPVRWGLLLVRRGGFAVAGGTTFEPSVHKVGRRHVQGTTKAGGWSQKRYSRRRDNQAREAFDAAADHVHRLLVTDLGDVESLVCGGDRKAVEAVFTDPRLAGLAAVRTDRWLAVPDPNAKVLADAVSDAWSAAIEIVPTAD